MKLYIFTDLEGPAGVSRWEQTREETPAKRDAMHLLTQEVNAAVQGILDVDPKAQVIVWDGHGPGGILFEEIHPAAQVILRGTGIRPPYGLDRTFQGVLFVGQHAMAGTAEAPLCHTYSSGTIEYYKINGQAYGEFGCRAAMAGEMGVSTIFLAGDDKACAEAQALVPQIVTVATKVGMGLELALHLSAPAARQRIRTAAAEAVLRCKDIRPFVIAPPYEQEIRLTGEANVEGYLRRGAKKVDERTVVKRADTLLDLWV